VSRAAITLLLSACSPPPSPSRATAPAPRHRATASPDVDDTKSRHAPTSRVSAPPGSIRFLAFGDTILTHSVGRAIAAAKDPGTPFTSLASTLASVDFNYANLEAPLEADTPLAGLGAHRFQVLNLANNHIMDGELARLLLTRSRLAEVGVVTSGVGEDLDAAWAPGRVEIRGLSVGFLGASYTSKNASREIHLPYVARIQHRERRRAAIRSAKAEMDFVVVAMHAGAEFITSPVGEQLRFARGAIDDGADVVIGTHPHVVQPVERYGGGFIFYSLGNFVFDQDHSEAVKESVAIEVQLSPRGSLECLTAIPIYNPDMMHPQLAHGARAAVILERLRIDDPSIYAAEGATCASSARQEGSEQHQDHDENPERREGALPPASDENSPAPL